MASVREQLSYGPVELSFGTSGLRGLVTDMTDLECYINTAGFLEFLRSFDDLREDETVYVAGDLRDSTPRITKAVIQAIKDAHCKVVYCGLIPTPAVAFYALEQHAPAIMITGSHIPADRNGIKFYKRSGEVLKSDEAPIKAAVSAVRATIYAQSADDAFDSSGQLVKPPRLPEISPTAAEVYLSRYLSVFADRPLEGKHLVFYQHSAVGRDLLVELLTRLGAEVTAVGRSDVFIPIDSENVTLDNQAYFKQLATEHPGLFAIVSTDGDSDRPFVVDAQGVFHRGDVLGAVVATWLGADFAAYPVSSSDAVDAYLAAHAIASTHTRIGSPYVIEAMQTAIDKNQHKVVGWEVNGGFLTGSDLTLDGQLLKSLPTRDAIFPIIVALLAAAQAGQTVAEHFGELPIRFTQAGLINNFPQEVSQAILQRFAEDNNATRSELQSFFTPDLGFGAIDTINSLDGIRIKFVNGDITHLRPSGNAPQLRIYSVADTQQRADEIVAQALAEPDGIFRRIQAVL